MGSTELAWGLWGRQAAEVGPRVLAGGPTLAALPPPRTWCRQHSQPPGQLQLVLLAAGQVSVVMCPVHSVPPHGPRDNAAGLGPEHLEPDSCGHCPLWFQLLPRAHELLAGDAFIRLAFLQETHSGSRCECCSWLRTTAVLFCGRKEPPSHSPLSSFLPNSMCSWALLPFSLDSIREKTLMSPIFRDGNAKLHLRMLICFMFCISVCPSVKW